MSITRVRHVPGEYWSGCTTQEEDQMSRNQKKKKSVQFMKYINIFYSFIIRFYSRKNGSICTIFRIKN